MVPSQIEIENKIHNNMKFAFFDGSRYQYFFSEQLADLTYKSCSNLNKSRVFDIYDLYFFSTSQKKDHSTIH